MPARRKRTRSMPGRGLEACDLTMWSICRRTHRSSGLRVEDLHEYGAAPAFVRIGAAEAGKARRQRFDQKRESEALVTRMSPPNGGSAPGVGGERGWIVDRVLVVDQPRAGRFRRILCWNANPARDRLG
jgi:hypothetical protein